MNIRTATDNDSNDIKRIHYGAPHYSGRFGFNVDVARQYISPYKHQHPFGWQAIALKEFGIEKNLC